jgi:hypothetical protein
MEFVSRWSLLEYDPNYNMSRTGTPREPVVWVMFISGFVCVFDGSSVRSINTSCKLYGKS